jgi:uncharacterized protein (DUF2461 family)
MNDNGFQPTRLHFLHELAHNNDRAWSQENKSRYELEVLEPSKRYIAVRNLTEWDVLKTDFIDSVATACATSRAYMRFLCEALSLPF